MGNIVFKNIGLHTPWENSLMELTPIEKIGLMYFKREDYFAPLGYGGINGSKLRQAIYLVYNYIKSGGNGKLISGASVKSPQLPMGSAVAMHFGLQSLHVIGATKPETAIQHENVRMATWFGAKFDIIKVGYNPVLQNRVKNIISKGGDYFYLNYGITTPAESNIEDITSFHLIGANQAKNIPDDIKNIFIPAGSCNSCISVILGIMLNRPKGLKNIHLIGISPNKVKFIFDRLKSIGDYLGENLLDFNKCFEGHDYFIVNGSKNSLNLFYYDLHETGFTNYQEEIKFHYEGINFHPTYEGKCFYWLVLNSPNLIREDSLFWIIGSKPYIDNMSFLKSELGDYPSNINLYERSI